MPYTNRWEAIEIRGFKLVVPSDVYRPSDDSFLLADNLTAEADDEALELGCGCGLLSIIVARKAEKVTAVDISPSAVEACRRNVELNGLEGKIQVRLGDLFRPLSKEEKFNVIIFNPPYLPSEEDDGTGLLAAAWNGGDDGRKIIDRFLSEVKFHLKEKGQIIMVQSNLSDVEKTISTLLNQGFSVRILGEKNFDFEKLFCIEARL